MTFRKRLLATIGAMALVASSLGTAGVAMAQDATQTTSIHVENTNCVDETPTSITMINEHRQFPNRDPQNPGQSIRIGTYMGINMYVNECLGQGWTVTASITDFHSGGNVYPSAGNFHIMGYNFSPVGVVGPDGFTAVPGTTPLPTSPRTTFTSNGPGSNLSTMNLPLSTGTTESVGQMYQYFIPSLHNMPSSLPGGDYQATLTMTFTSDGP